jgi:phage shock protein PspC (stress-responsive transcriptional regulator)
MTVLAAIRPDDWNLPLFLHILGAMTMVGALVLSLTALATAWRGNDIAPVRLGYRALLLGVLPAWLVTRLTAQWIVDKEGLEDSEVAWIEIGFMTSEPGLLFLIVATVLTGLAVRRARGGTGVRVATVLTALMLLAYLVAVWAMTTKPV